MSGSEDFHVMLEGRMMMGRDFGKIIFGGDDTNGVWIVDLWDSYVGA